MNTEGLSAEEILAEMSDLEADDLNASFTYIGTFVTSSTRTSTLGTWLWLQLLPHIYNLVDRSLSKDG